MGLKQEKGRGEHLLSWKRGRDSVAKGECSLLETWKDLRRRRRHNFLVSVKSHLIMSLEFGMGEASE